MIDLVHGKLLYRRTGLVLWIVPTTQIYRQTLISLKDRDHPYRQQIDLASAGRTMVLEKTSGFRPADVADSLCILLLMLPSANRETKEQLRMFRDSGGFDRFFPGDDDAAGHRAVLERVPNLDTFEGSGFWGRQVKTSLGNTLRLLRPMIVLDEGHKAYSRNAKATLEGFNPSLIVELSATPTAEANVLIEIFGDSPMEPAEPVVRRQRARFRRAARDLVLPAFMIRDGGAWRPAHYEADILSRTPWDEVDVTPFYDLPLGERPGDEIEMQVGVDGGVAAASTHAAPDGPGGGGSLDHAFAASHLLDVMPNPWRGSELARRVFGALLDRHARALVVSNYGFILEELRKRLEIERDRLARGVFSGLLEAGEMRFIVAAEDLGFNRRPRQIRTAASRQANREDGGQYLLNLFDRTDENELNALENRVATFLDRQERLFFWYRNRARQDYYVQGWKRGRIYADFIFTLKPDDPDAADPFHQVFVVETKGLHLEEAADTEYKRSVFDICSRHATRCDWAEFGRPCAARPCASKWSTRPSGNAA